MLSIYAICALDYTPLRTRLPSLSLLLLLQILLCLLIFSALVDAPAELLPLAGSGYAVASGADLLYSAAIKKIGQPHDIHS